MNFRQSKPEKSTVKAALSIGLKFRIIFPFFILISLIIVVLAMVLNGGNQFSLELLFISIVALLAAVGLGLLLAGQIEKRIKEVIEAAEKVTRGDLSVRLNDNHRDEIGRFSHVFNQMIANLDHLYHSRDLLSRTMSPPVRQSLIEKGLDFGGITQEVSILFVDIRGFTRITEVHNTDQVVSFLNDYYTTIANQVHAGGGIIGKYGGDSILAFFGAPEPEPPAKSSISALLTALAVQEALEQMNQRWMALGLPPIRVGIGISIGPAVAGPIGSEQQFEYTVIGDAVNLASRLQDLTRNIPGYGIIISKEVHDALEERVKNQIQIISLSHYQTRDTRQRVKHLMEFVDFGEVMVKGKQETVRVYGIPD